MQRITLSKDWNKHKEGSVVMVDDLRAAWLKKGGFEAKKGKKSKGVFVRPISGLVRPGSRKSLAQRPSTHRGFGYNHESKYFSAKKGRATRATLLSPS